MPTTNLKGMGETIMKTGNCPGQGDVYRMVDRRRNLRANVWDKAKKLSEEYRTAMISLYKESEKNTYL